MKSPVTATTLNGHPLEESEEDMFARQPDPDGTHLKQVLGRQHQPATAPPPPKVLTQAMVLPPPPAERKDNGAKWQRNPEQMAMGGLKPPGFGKGKRRFREEQQALEAGLTDSRRRLPKMHKVDKEGRFEDWVEPTPKYHRPGSGRPARRTRVPLPLMMRC